MHSIDDCTVPAAHHSIRSVGNRLVYAGRYLRGVTLRTETLKRWCTAQTLANLVASKHNGTGDRTIDGARDIANADFPDPESPPIAITQGAGGRSNRSANAR